MNINTVLNAVILRSKMLWKHDYNICGRSGHTLWEWMVMASGHTPAVSSPRPLPVEKHLKMTILMSRPSWIQILFMIRITCRVSISCRRSSPDWTEISQRSGGLWTHSVRQVKDFTLKMTLMLSPLGSRFWKDSLRGTALELKKEHNYKREREISLSEVSVNTHLEVLQ